MNNALTLKNWVFGRNGLQTQIGPWKEAFGVLYFYFDNSPFWLISASSLDRKHTD